MLEAPVLVALAIAVAVAVLGWRGAGHLVGTRWGRLGLLVAAAVLPVAVTVGALASGVKESSSTRFCLSCHEMEPYGRSLFADNRQALAAVHYQDRLVTRDGTCYGCHTNYGLFGDVKAKLNGLRHVYVHYLGTIPERPKLYEPYPNANCLHCHDDARGFLEKPVHTPLLADLQAGRQSCLSCHKVAHDHESVAAGKLWQAE